MLIQSATIDWRKQKRNQTITLAVWLFGVIAFCLASGLTLVAQDAQPDVAAVDAKSKATVEPPKPYDSMDIAEEYQMPPEPKPGASKDEIKAYRTKSREVRDRIRGTEKSIKTALEGSGNLSGVSGGFTNFMQGYVFPRMTQTDKATLANLGELREDFLDDYLSDDVRGNARQQVISATIPVMQQIFENQGDKNYHEAARLNAILVMGMIDAQPASRDTNTFPTPSTQAFQELVNVFTNDKYPPFLRIGALAGIQRHAEIDRHRAQTQLSERGQITQEAMRILQAPENNDADYWLKRRSVQVLGYLGDVGSNSEVLDEIKKIAEDDQQKKWLRFDAITALGNLDYNATVKDEAKDIPIVVAQYVAQSLDSESTELKEKLYELIKKNILFEDVDLEKIGNADQEKGGRSSRGSGIGAGGGGLADDEPPPSRGGPGGNIDLGPRVELANYHLNDARRKVKVIAYTAKQVISTKSLADLVDKSLVDNLIEELDKFIEAADVGIKNLDEDEPEIDPDDEEAVAEAKKTNTTKMYELYADYAKRIDDLIPRKPAAAADNPDKADQAEGPFANDGN